MLLVIGFSSGSIEVRKHRTGDLLHKTSMSNAVTALFYYDYRQEGLPQVIAIDSEGEVKGMTLTRQVKQFTVQAEVAQEMAADSRLLELNKKKIELMTKLEQVKAKKEAD